MTPLTDIVVLDLSQNLAGPFCGQILGDLGADVIKVEPPGRGDPARAWGPPFWEGEGTMFLSVNRNKRGVAIDLKTQQGREVVGRLVDRADVVIQSFRAGVAERLGVDWGAVQSSNARAVYCEITAFGTAGPMRERPGFDPLLQAYGGLMSVTGVAGGEPARVGASVVDLGTGMWAAIGILAALGERERTGVGCRVGTSLFETTVNLMGYHLLGHLATGTIAAAQGTAHAMIAPYEAFPTADGSVMICAANDGLFRRSCAALGLDALAEDARFRDNASRVTHRRALFDAVAAVTRRHPSAVVEARLQEAGVPCAPIQTVDRVVADPQTRAVGALVPGDHPRIDDFRTVALPVVWNQARAPVRRPPPARGEHTAEVLRELGYTDAERRRLEAKGIVEG